MECSFPNQYFQCFLLLIAEKNEPLFTEMKALQPPEVKLYLRSITFYPKSSYTMYMLFHKISVFILKIFLDKVWRKLKAPGTLACLSLKLCNPLACCPELPRGHNHGLGAKGRTDFQYCCKAVDKSIKGRK